jgi:asparagine synthase (glutamine-hydrolysing)
LANITLSRRDDALHVTGDLQYLRNVDPNRDQLGTTQYSLRAGWRWDGAALEVFADRCGMIPIFYRQTAQRIVIASSLREICEIAGPVGLDAAALAVYLRLGFFVGDDTPLEGVRVLCPGVATRITVADWQVPRPSRPGKLTAVSMTRRDAHHTYSHLFQSAVQARCSEQRVALPLSGGRDSRHILFALARANRLPALAVTSALGPYGAAEFAAAKSLCEPLGITQWPVEQSSTHYLRAESAKNLRTHFLTDEHLWYSQVFATLQRHGAQLIFDGLGGDVLSNGLFFDVRLAAAFRSDDPRAVAACLLGEADELAYLAQDVRDLTSFEVARDRLTLEVAQHMGRPNPIQSFFFWNRTCREIALSPIVLVEDIEVALPYVTADLIELLTSLPLEQFGAAGFHDEVIRADYPQFAHIPYADKRGRAPDPVVSASDRARFLGFLPRLLRNRSVARRFASARLLRLVASGDFEREEWWLRSLLYLDGLQQLAQSRLVPR